MFSDFGENKNNFILTEGCRFFPYGSIFRFRYTHQTTPLFEQDRKYLSSHPLCFCKRVRRIFLAIQLNYNFDLCMDNIAHVIVIVLQSQLENLHVNLVNVRFRFVKLLPLGEVRNHFSLDMKRDKVDSLSN